MSFSTLPKSVSSNNLIGLLYGFEINRLVALISQPTQKRQPQSIQQDLAKKPIGALQKIILDHKDTLNTPDATGNTFVHYLTQRKDITIKNWKKWTEIFETLQNHKVNLNIPDNDGNTAVHIACKDANLGMIELLYNANAIFCKKNADNQTPLEAALSAGKSKVKDFFEYRGIIEDGGYLRPTHNPSSTVMFNDTTPYTYKLRPIVQESSVPSYYTQSTTAYSSNLRQRLQSHYSNHFSGAAIMTFGSYKKLYKEKYNDLNNHR